MHLFWCSILVSLQKSYIFFVINLEVETEIGSDKSDDVLTYLKMRQQNKVWKTGARSFDLNPRVRERFFAKFKAVLQEEKQTKVQW